MSANLALAVRHPGGVAVAVSVLVLAKGTVAFVVGLVKRRSARIALRFSLALPEGSEFSFVLFGAAVAGGALDRADDDLATVVVAVSMVVTPVLFAASECLVILRLGERRTGRGPGRAEVRTG